MNLKPKLHTDVDAHVRAINALLDQLEDLVDANYAAIRRARELNEAIEKLRNQIAARQCATAANPSSVALWAYLRVELTVAERRGTVFRTRRIPRPLVSERSPGG